MFSLSVPVPGQFKPADFLPGHSLDEGTYNMYVSPVPSMLQLGTNMIVPAWAVRALSAKESDQEPTLIETHEWVEIDFGMSRPMTLKLTSLVVNRKAKLEGVNELTRAPFANEQKQPRAQAAQPKETSRKRTQSAPTAEPQQSKDDRSDSDFDDLDIPVRTPSTIAKLARHILR